MLIFKLIIEITLLSIVGKREYNTAMGKFTSYTSLNIQIHTQIHTYISFFQK